jgi:hypothetical protein
MVRAMTGTSPYLGRTLRLFLVDGTPTGILTAEIMNWTGLVAVAPRSRLAELIARPETSRTGVYFLTGQDPGSPTRPVAYIGESDGVADRLRQHNKEGTDFWNRVCLVVSKDQNLTKAHVRYLEGRLIGLAKKAGRAKLLNGTSGTYGFLPEPDVADMEFFLQQIQIVLPVLGLDILRKPIELPQAEAGPAQQPPAPTFELRSVGLHATAVEADGAFVVHKGSTARADAKAAQNQYKRQQEQLLAEGKLQPTEDPAFLVFTEDVPFSSPSAAAAVVLDRNANGRLEWKVQGTRQTYAQWQEAQITAAAGGDTPS